MNFYYDPILGLVYTMKNPIIELVLSAIPHNYSFEDFKEMWSRIGVIMFDSQKEIQEPIVHHNGITTYFIV